jgi:hypothetical protein
VSFFSSRAQRQADLPGVLGAVGRVHSRYQRRLADLPVAGRLVELCLTVRRFFCGNPDCGRRTFAEQINGLTRRRARRSEPLRVMLTSIGLAVAGRAGVRLATKVGIRTSRNSLLRLVRAFPEPEVGSVRMLGVDDFAVERGPCSALTAGNPAAGWSGGTRRAWGGSRVSGGIRRWEGRGKGLGG